MTEKPSLLRLVAQSILILILVRTTYILLAKVDTHVFIDGVNLLIHEAGHLVFQPFGRFLTVLGGTLMQLIIPSLFIFYFLRKKDFFATFFCLFWFGENFVNTSYYIADAKNKVLPLITDNIDPTKEGHDWAYILPKLHLLDQAKLLGKIVFWVGGFIMILSISAMILFTTLKFLEYLEYKTTNNSNKTI